MYQFIQTLCCCLLIALLSGLGLSGCQAYRSEAADVIHLTLWHGVNPPPNRDVLNRLIRQFNQEHPTIQVQALYVGQPDQQLPKILAAVVGNAVPDLLWFAPVLTGQLVELDAIRPLDDWFARSAQRDRIDPVLLNSMTLEGHIWSVPFGTNNIGIFYRPSLFAAANVTHLPETWDELRQVARQLSHPADKTGRKAQYGMLLPLGKGEWTVFTWLPFLWSAGGKLVTAPGEPITVMSEGAIAALQFWRDLLTDGSAILSPPERGYDIDAFLAGKVAMQLSGPWTLRQLRATGVDFGVLPIPTQAQRATALGGENLFMFKTSPEREQAVWTFLDYVLSPSFQTQWAMGTGYLPVNLDARQSDEYQNFTAHQPVISTFLEQAPYGHSRPIVAGYNRISEQVGRAIEAVLLGKAEPQQALQTAQQRLDLAIGSQ